MCDRKRPSTCLSDPDISEEYHSNSNSSPPLEAPRRTSKPRRKSDNGSDANIRNFAPVARIMKTALPENAKIAKEAKECMQECVSEFISFITSEGMYFERFGEKRGMGC